MTTSGTVSATLFTNRQLYDHAFRRCRLPPQRVTAEHLAAAKGCLYLALSALSNKGIQLWCLDKQILGLYQNLSAVTLPLGTVDVISNQNFRTLTRQDGTYTSSAGGTVDNAFDDDFATKCTQTAPDGNIRIEFSADTLISTVGILPGATATWSPVFETSADGVTWTTVLAVGSTDYVDEQWAWYDIDGSLAALYFRVRETGGGTLSVREMYPGNTPNEIPLGVISQGDYTALANKTFPGRPAQFWLDRQRAYPVMRIWPVPALANRYDQIVIWRQRYIQDVGTMVQTVDVPQRWFKATVLALAAELAMELTEVPETKAISLRAEADVAIAEALGEERDSSPFSIAVSIGPYTR